MTTTGSNQKQTTVTFINGRRGRQDPNARSEEPRELVKLGGRPGTRNTLWNNVCVEVCVKYNWSLPTVKFVLLTTKTVFQRLHRYTHFSRVCFVHSVRLSVVWWLCDSFLCRKCCFHRVWQTRWRKQPFVMFWFPDSRHQHCSNKSMFTVFQALETGLESRNVFFTKKALEMSWCGPNLFCSQFSVCFTFTKIKQKSTILCS